MISSRSLPLSAPPAPPKTTLLFLRLDSAAVFLPLHLSPTTLTQLKTQIKEKFTSLADARVSSRAVATNLVTTACFSLGQWCTRQRRGWPMCWTRQWWTTYSQELSLSSRQRRTKMASSTSLLLSRIYKTFLTESSKYTIVEFNTLLERVSM